MNDFRKMLESFVPQQTEETQIPFTPQATMPDDLAKAAEMEAQAMPAPVAPVRAPAASMNSLEEGNKLLSQLQNKPLAPIENTSNSSETRTKTSVSGTVPSSDKAEGSMSAEERLEKLMRDLNEERKREMEDASSRKFKADIFKIIGDNVGGLVGGAQAMNTKAAVNPIKTQGYDVGDLVGQVERKFAGDREALMDQYKQLLSARDRSEQRKFQQDTLQVQREGNAIKNKLAEQKANKLSNTLSPGEEAADKNFAKDYNNLTSKGFNNADTAIKRLESLAGELEKEGDGVFATGGGRTSILPDVLRSQDSIRRRDAAANEANSTLKELFPGSLSDDERRAAAREYYNDKLSNSENAKIIKEKAKQLRRSYQDQQRKAQYFSENGTLKGLGPETAPVSGDMDAKVDSFMKKNNITDRNEAIKILKDAGKI